MITAAESRFASGSADPASFGRDLAELGRRHGTVFDEYMGALVVLRHKDVSAGLRDPNTFSTSFYGVGPMASMMIAHGGAEHARQRRIHNRFFSPAASERYASRVVPIAERNFERLVGLDRAELVGDVLARYPMEVFLDLLGIPNDLGDRGLEWVRAIVAWTGSPMNEELAAPGQHAFDELRAYAAKLVEAERTAPSDNLLGEIVRAHLEEGGFSVDACTVAVVSLLLGGLETTIQMLSATIASLLLNPDALARLNTNRALCDAAIDEAFRWASPSAGLYRLVTSDVDVDGVPVKAGDMVYLCIAAAHFDELAYPRPEVYDLERRPSHLGFGLGPHYCVGAPLARIEVRAALDALLDRFPGIRLERPLNFFYGARGFVQHGTEQLPVLLTSPS
ncbi:cytochrome P450 [Kibdelosporangium persicum]|uniref:Cytochrome P450 hydroxylase n=1 Tax=Kibdelosporangium persicum TaxID=2698649 RepID=A0ABX2F519_9PSEU|nr:cytochrome P450 [Kibdelosporangium persicum]NRN65938.1 putative cytochrome P450 hydroxylase [Kibdelosporangium persicum]